MSKKKQNKSAATSEEYTQAQQILEQYHEITRNLRLSTSPGQAKEALSEIDALPEAVQIALVKMLAKEQHTDAADLLVGINEFAELKEARKEARRALIQLEGTRIYSNWKPPVERYQIHIIPEAMPHRATELDVFDDDLDFVDEDEEDYEDEDEDEEHMDLTGLNPEQVVTTFVDKWSLGMYHIAYRLLASDSLLRQGLTVEEWVERREAWAEEADPREEHGDYVKERVAQKSKLWLPRPISAKQDDETRVLEAGWSLELAETSLDDTLPELPRASIVYTETDRHWFWVSFTLVQDEGEWRIQSMADESVLADSLSVEELAAKMKGNLEESEHLLQAYLKKPERSKQEDHKEQALRIVSGMLRASYYLDALTRQIIPQKELLERIINFFVGLQQYEHCLAYLELVQQHYPDDRANTLQKMSLFHRMARNQYIDEEDDENASFFLELAMETLEELLTIREDASTHITLAELLLDEDVVEADENYLEEAEQHLLRAMELTDDSHDIAHIEYHLGQVESEREAFELAAGHFQRALDLEPDHAGYWSALTEAQLNLDDLPSAEKSYRRSIDLDPDNTTLIINVSRYYEQHGQPDKAVEVVEESLENNPDLVDLYYTLAMIYVERDDMDNMEKIVDRLALIDPDSDMLYIIRATLNMMKSIKSASPPRKTPSSQRIISSPKQPTPLKLSRPGKKKRR